jgi:DNA-binding NtrC family response regulator
VYPALERRSFPGNVRELKNVIERAAILSSGDVVTIADLPEDPRASPFDDDAADSSDAPETVRATLTPTPPTASVDRAPSSAEIRISSPSEPRLTLKEYRDRAERLYIIEVLASLEWNISRAAIILGVERTHLHKKIRAYGIKRGESRRSKEQL